MAKIIELEEKRQFRVLLNPVRQDIIHLLRRAGRPLTANGVAQRMHLAPNAAQKHLRKLAELGMVEVAERTARDGSPVTVYRLADVEFRLGLGRKDSYQGEREALAATMVDGTFRGLVNVSHQYGLESMDEHGMLLFGVLHLPAERRKELIELVSGYIKTHSLPAQEDAEHWEYVLMAYREEEGE